MPKKEDKTPITESSHWNKKFSQSLWNEIMALIRNDVPVERACKYAKIKKQTFYNRINWDEDLMDEFKRSKEFMHVLTSSVITSAINDDTVDKDKRADLAMKWKKVRDKRYKPKSQLSSDPDAPMEILVRKIGAPQPKWRDTKDEETEEDD